MASPKLRKLLVGLGLSAAVLLLIEGACSLLVFGWEVWTRFELPIQERHHTAYDPELGWVNLPEVDEPDLYAPGRGFTSNSLGFRDSREFQPAVPAGKLRVICAGDSFTLGYGVDDADSFPARLEAGDGRLEVVNMGQGGYGIDQSWLWYRRDALVLEHQLVVLAFIGDDFERMRRPSFRGYGKPLLRERRGQLLVENVPVPKASFRLPLWTQNAGLLRQLRSVQLAERVLRKLTGRSAAAPFELAEDEARRVALAVFHDLQALTSEHGARLALVLLPNLDSRQPDALQGVPVYALEALELAADAGLVVIDLQDAFAALDPSARRALFIPRGELSLPGAHGHYNADGNAFVAERLHERLVAAGLLPPR